ncbi:energy transducer TonB [bacterium]|nr:energy transducer TonB [bacterium]
MRILFCIICFTPLLTFAQTADSTEYVDPPEELEIIEQEEQVYDIYAIDQTPLFNDQDVDAGLSSYLSKNVSYPDTAMNSEVQGKVVVSFTINKDSSISDVKVVSNPIGFGLEEEAIRVIESTSGMWTPAIHRGAYVAVRYRIPIVFVLY